MSARSAIGAVMLFTLLNILWLRASTLWFWQLF
jgi:hypothetical protein